MFTLLNVIVTALMILLIFGTAGVGAMLNEQGELDTGFAASSGGVGLLMLVWGLAVLIPSSQ